MSNIDFELNNASQHLLGIINSNREEILNIFKTQGDSTPKFFKGQMIVFPDFADYAAKYMEEGAVLENAMGYIEEKGYAPPYQTPKGDTVFSRTINRFSDNPIHEYFNTDGTRNSQSYILDADELTQAKKFIVGNPSLHVSIAAMQGCLTCYVDDLFQELRKLAGAENDKDLKYIINRLDGEFGKNADSDSFIRDMSPLIALALSEKEQVFNPDSLKDKNMLRSFFQKHVFKSSAYFPGNIPDTRRCPFAPNFVQVMSIKFTPDENGLISADKGDFGDTVSFIESQINLTVEQKATVVDTMRL